MALQLTGSGATSIEVPADAKALRLDNGSWVALFYYVVPGVGWLAQGWAEIAAAGAPTGMLLGYDMDTLGDTDETTIMEQLISDANGLPVSSITPANVAAFFSLSTLAQQISWAKAYRLAVLQPLEAKNLVLINAAAGAINDAASFFTYLGSLDTFTKNADGSWSVAPAT